MRNNPMSYTDPTGTVTIPGPWPWWPGLPGDCDPELDPNCDPGCDPSDPLCDGGGGGGGGGGGKPEQPRTFPWLTLPLGFFGSGPKPPVAVCHCKRTSTVPTTTPEGPGRCPYTCSCGVGVKFIQQFTEAQSYDLEDLQDVKDCKSASKNGTECPPNLNSVSINIGFGEVWVPQNCSQVQ